jgi:lactam utilization protein B
MRKMKILWDAIKRTVALVGTEIALIMAAGSVMEIEAWKAAVVAGLSAAMSVWAAIGRAYYKDGKLTKDEVDEAFSGE